MLQIINNTDYCFSPVEQKEIESEMKHAGIKTVYTQRESLKTEDQNLFNFYADADFSTYVFSLDTDADGGCTTFNK